MAAHVPGRRLILSTWRVPKPMHTKCSSDYTCDISAKGNRGSDGNWITAVTIQEDHCFSENLMLKQTSEEQVGLGEKKKYKGLSL